MHPPFHFGRECEPLNVSFLKVHGPIFPKFNFIFDLKDHHTKDVNFKVQLKWSNRLDLVSNFVYCSCLYHVYNYSM